MDNMLDNILANNESIIWSGKPRQGVILNIIDTPGIIIGAIQLLVSLFLFIMFVRGNIHYDFMFITGVFAVYSVLTFYAMIFANAELRRRTNYTITNRSIFINYGCNSNKIKTFSLKFAIPELPPQSFLIADLPKVALQYVAKDGYGTIEFDLPAIYKSFWGVRGGGSVVSIYPRLEYIENAEEVYKLILDAKHKLEFNSSDVG